MKHGKKISSLLMALVLLVGLVPVPRAQAAVTYSVSDAITYAKAHWNDGVGMCAEFVSKCVQAGGLNMSTVLRAGPCLTAAAKASGLSVQTLTLNSSGYAMKASNADKLAAGDVVAQYCATHGTTPHIMFCGGYDSQGRATFYGHSAAINNTAQKLNVNTAYEHTTSCQIQAQVVHLSGLSSSTTSSSGGTSSSAPKVSFSQPTDSTYVNKKKVTNTNAVVVNKITKESGVKVTKMGLYLYDANGKQLKKYSESVSNVTASQTTYHSWYDITSELGLTLTPGTTYQYAFFGVFNGVEVKSSTLYSFTTTGTAPSSSGGATNSGSTGDSSTNNGTTSGSTATTTHQLTVWVVAGQVSYTTDVVEGKPLSDLVYDTTPEYPYVNEADQYTFDGYYTAASGGTRADMTQTVTADLTLYAHWTQKATAYQVIYQDPATGTTYGTYSVTNGQTYPAPSSTPTRAGYTFSGWYTGTGGTGTQVTTGTTVSGLTGTQYLYAYWVREVSNTMSLRVGSPILTVNGTTKTIDAQGTTPVILNNRTMIPVRAVIESMGGTVGWNSSARIASCTLGSKTMYLQIGSTTAWDQSGAVHLLDTAPTIVNDRTLLPIRYVVEYLGGTVDWEAATKTVTITWQ